MTETEQFTALDLLHRFVELHLAVPDRKNWTPEALADSPIRLHKLQCLRALFSAFGLKWEPERWQPEASWPSYTARCWALGQSQELHGPLIERLAGEKVAAECRHLGLDEELLQGLREETLSFSPYLEFYFANLYGFRYGLARLLHDDAIILEAPWAGQLAAGLVESWHADIRKGMYDELDKRLVEVIDPRERSFSKEELVAEHGFPNESAPFIDYDDM